MQASEVLVSFNFNERIFNMNIDDKRFIEFMQLLFNESYSIRYIDAAHCQSIESKSFTVATIYGAVNYKHGEIKDMFEHIINEIRADYKDKNIKHIIFRIDNAIVCIKPWREF